MKEYDYLNAGREIKNFYWNSFCDWYLETTKIRIYSQTNSRTTALVVLLHVLERSLRLLHPFVPHLTEVLWQALPESCKNGPALIIAPWPDIQEELISQAIDVDFTLLQELIQNIRRVLKTFNVPLRKPIPLLVTTRDKHSLIQNSRDEIVFLARLDENSFKLMDTITEQPNHSVRISVTDITAYVLLEGLIDLELEHERISKQIDKVEKQIRQLNIKLASPFVQKADPKLVEIERSKIVEFEEKLEQLQEQLSFIA